MRQAKKNKSAALVLIMAGLFLGGLVAGSVPAYASHADPVVSILATQPQTDGTIVTGQFSPIPNALLIVGISAWNITGTPFTFNVIDAISGTPAWVEQVTQTSNTLDFHRVSIWTSQAEGTVGTGAMTVSGTGGTMEQGRVNVIQITGHEPSDPVLQIASAGPETDSTFTLNFPTTPAPASFLFGAIGTRTDTAVTPGVGWTEIADSAGGPIPNDHLQTQHSIGLAVVDWTNISTIDAQTDAVAIEVSPLITSLAEGHQTGFFALAVGLATVIMIAGTLNFLFTETRKPQDFIVLVVGVLIFIGVWGTLLAGGF